MAFECIALVKGIHGYHSIISSERRCWLSNGRDEKYQLMTSAARRHRLIFMKALMAPQIKLRVKKVIKKANEKYGNINMC